MTHIIAMAQTNPVVGDLDGNAQQIITAYEQMSATCDILITGEMSLSGYQTEDLTNRPGFMHAVKERADALAAHVTGRAALIVGLPWMHEDGSRMNAAAIMQNGQITDIRAKHALPNSDVYDDRRHFTAGALPEPVIIQGTSYGVMICEDMWNDHVAAHLASRGAQVFITLNGSAYYHDIDKTRKGWAMRHAMRHSTPLYYVNLVGGQDEIIFDGGSFALNAQGQTIGQMPFGTETTGLIANYKPSEYAPVQLDKTLITLALRDYMHKNGFHKVLLGLSGGIDSALVAALACDALGADNVQCVMMPSPYTAQQSCDDAAQLVKSLGCDMTHIDIAPIMHPFEAALDIHAGLAHENMQSRIRANLLMSLSNDTGALVLTTGNKSEMAVGYATLYGDMCGAFNPLKDVYKTRVYAMAKEDKRIPNSIITRPASAELRPDQLDQDSLPTYEQLDHILCDLIEGQMDYDALITAGHDANTVKQIIKLVARSEYKRRQAPPGPKITRRAFGRDRRLPITNAYDWCIPSNKDDLLGLSDRQPSDKAVTL